jgi:hypothetical protein
MGDASACMSLCGTICGMDRGRRQIAKQSNEIRRMLHPPHYSAVLERAFLVRCPYLGEKRVQQPAADDETGPAGYGCL